MRDKRCWPQQELQIDPPRAGHGRFPFRAEQYEQKLICFSNFQSEVGTAGE